MAKKNHRSKRAANYFPNSYVVIYCIVAGLLVFGAIALLRWNEQDAGKDSRVQEALSSACVDMADPGRIDASLDGKLVYAKGKAVGHELLTDDEFGVSARGIALYRSSEYYQWVEKYKKEELEQSDGTMKKERVPTYDKKWVGAPVDSRLFKDKHYRNRNTVYREVPNGSVLSDNVMFGAYRLSEELVRRISTTEKVDEKYLSKHDMSFAQVGDVRVTFSRVPEEVAVTIVGKVQGGTAQRYVVSPTLPDQGHQPVFLRRLYSLFLLAAGDGYVLDPGEKTAFERNRENTAFMQSYRDALKVDKFNTSIEQARQVFGLKKFLEDFTLIGERGAQESLLWKDYMVYAMLFGIADRVWADMKTVNPEFFGRDPIAALMADKQITTPLYQSALAALGEQTE